MLIQAVTHYLNVRRAGGFSLKTTEGYLRHYAAFATQHGDTHVVSQTAIAWAAQTLSEAQRANRLQVITRFARFVRAEDCRHEIPPDNVFCSQRHRPTPYIFSEEEIRKIVIFAARLGPAESLRAHTYSTLFGLLAVTGLRPSEALALHLNDVTPDGLVVRESKFRKSRLVPLHESTVEILKRYVECRCKVVGLSDHLFVSGRKRQLSRTVVVETFHKVLDAAEIRGRPNRLRLRLMDLRHTFAVRSLEHCPDGRDGVGRHMLALATYMGHARVESTYWYLENTPELLSDIAQAAETFVYGETR